MTNTIGPALVLGALLSGCGGAAPAPPVGNRAAAPARQPVIVYFAYGEDAVFEADCWAPGGDCAAIRAQALAGGELVAGAARFRITGTRPEECDASGDTGEVVAYRRLAGPDDVSPGVTTFPAAAPIDLVTLGSAWDAAATPLPVDAALAALLRARAAADVEGDAARAADGQLEVTQVVTGNFTGGPAPDQLIAADIPLGDADGPGYVWSALVLIPDGDQARATSLWHSELDAYHVDAHYDLDGDGVREFLFTAAYYEGAASGAAAIVDGQVVVGASIGCGA